MERKGRNPKPIKDSLAALQQLSSVLGATDGLQGQLGEVKALLGELETAREAMNDALETVAGLHGELVKQRAVFMRMLPVARLDLGRDHWLEVEKRLREEYDELRARLDTEHETFTQFVQGGT